MFAAVHIPDFDPARTPDLLACAADFSPLVEETFADTIVFPVSGLGRWYSTPGILAQAIAERIGELNLAANVAVAASVEIALAAARARAGITVIPRGHEEESLGPLSLDTLAIAIFGPEVPIAEMLVTLESWGVRTCADLAALPPLGVLERLGADGLRLQQISRGIAARPFRPAAAPVEYHERTELEYPVTLLEPLLFVVADHLNRLCARLNAHSMATHHVELSLRLENAPEHARAYQLPVPMRDPRAFLKLIHLDLEARPPVAPVTFIATRLIPVKPRVLQNGLFVPSAPEPEKLELTLARIARIVGQDRVGSPRLVNTHRPDSFTLSRLSIAPADAPTTQSTTAMVMRLFRPALAAHVDMVENHPARLATRGIRGTVIERAGPWRTAGDWWTGTPWSREEWDVALASGALYRIFHDDLAGGWFIEGEYD